MHDQVTQIGKWPSEDDDIEEDDEAVAGLASQVRREALQLVDALGMSVPVVSRLRSLLRRLPDHTLPDVLGALVKSTPDEKMKVRLQTGCCRFVSFFPLDIKCVNVQ